MQKTNKRTIISRGKRTQGTQKTETRFSRKKTHPPPNIISIKKRKVGGAPTDEDVALLFIKQFGAFYLESKLQYKHEHEHFIAKEKPISAEYLASYQMLIKLLKNNIEDMFKRWYGDYQYNDTPILIYPPPTGNMARDLLIKMLEYCFLYSNNAVNVKNYQYAWTILSFMNHVRTDKNVEDFIKPKRASWFKASWAVIPHNNPTYEEEVHDIYNNMIRIEKIGIQRKKQFKDIMKNAKKLMETIKDNGGAVYNNPLFTMHDPTPTRNGLTTTGNGLTTTTGNGLTTTTRNGRTPLKTITNYLFGTKDTTFKKWGGGQRWHRN